MFASTLVGVGVSRRIGELIRGISAGRSVLVAGRGPWRRRGSHAGGVGWRWLRIVVIEGGVGGGSRSEGGRGVGGMSSHAGAVLA